MAALTSCVVLYFFPPLKNMCSRKWLIPRSSFVSYREPAPAKTRTVTDSVPSLEAVQTVKLPYYCKAMLGKTRWRRRLRRHGFLKRSATADGRKVLARRRRKGRH